MNYLVLKAFLIGSFVAFMTTVFVSFLRGIELSQAAHYTIGVGGGSTAAIILKCKKKKQYE